jgi:hypothetical protein
MEGSNGAVPILVLGIAQRSGTHFLYDALLLHDDLVAATTNPDPAQPSWEDHLLSEADALVQYVGRVSARWNLDADRAELARADLLRSLGGALESFLVGSSSRSGAPPGRRPVTKTPFLVNLDLLDQLLPTAPVVVIVRDPRAVVASSRSSFGHSTERWIRVWQGGARILLRFMDSHPGRVTLVRFEALSTDPVGEMGRLLDRLGLDPLRYDFDRLVRLPVRGSSKLHAAGGGWTPVEAPPDFDPAHRGSQLPSRVTGRLEWILREELEPLGYGPVARPGIGGEIYQRAFDVAWAVARWGNRGLGAARAGAAELSRGRPD